MARKSRGDFIGHTESNTDDNTVCSSEPTSSTRTRRLLEDYYNRDQMDKKTFLTAGTSIENEYILLTERQFACDVSSLGQP